MKRPLRYPFLATERVLYATNRPCECCALPATHTIEIEMGPLQDSTIVVVCGTHLRMAFKREWRELFKQLDLKVDRTEHALGPR